MKKSLKKKQNGIIVIMLAVFALFAVLFTRAVSLREQKRELEAEYQKQLLRYEEEKERTDELRDLQAYKDINNRQYIEDEARKLGLVYPNEIIYKQTDDSEKLNSKEKDDDSE